MDALSDVLETIHLGGSVYCRSELSAPWGMALPDKPDLAQFHVVRRGRCFLREVGGDGAPLPLEAGDMVLLARGQAHTLSDSLSSPLVPLGEIFRCASPGVHEKTEPLRFGGGGEGVTLICGYFRFASSSVHPMLSVLPSVVLTRGEGGRPQRWLETTLDMLADEAISGSPGSETLMNRLTEVLFVQVLRAHLAEGVTEGPSWLTGLRDPAIGAALGHLHREPARAWTIEDLASRGGMSRSAFAARFREFVGEPPLQYLTRWRMQLAARRLEDERLSLAQVAEAVGYKAEASFSKVFKRMWGVAPGTFRRQQAEALQRELVGQGSPEERPLLA